ncbi:MAG TPA: N4-gp56 family major capsid protein [Dissulfurispiraceae bacterium]|nr:N4-gp56 family major capsid protein [Dissulfurispiraceae bacterium]
MADWTFTTADTLTAQTWAKKWWIQSKTESYFYGHGFVGVGTDNIIVEFPELEQNQGYQHTYGQVRELSGSGVLGDGTMEGNEDIPDVFDDNITITQKRNAIRSAGKLSEQYPSDKGVRQWAEELLKRWMAALIDQDIFDAIGTSPTKNIWGGDATTDITIEAGDYFTTSLISKAVAYAAKATPTIIGKSIKGKEMFVCVISPDQAFDLRTRDAAWSQAQREAQPSGDDNAIFSGKTGMWDQTVIHTHKRVATSTVWGSGLNLNGAAALFMGLQAGAIAYAKKKIWNEKTSTNQGSFTQECELKNDVNSGEARYEYALAA